MFFSFDNPVYLFFLFAVPFLILFHFLSLKHLKRSALKFANFDAIANVKGIDLFSKNILGLILDILFIFLLVFSLAGLNLHKNMEVSDFSFVIAIDASQSMAAEDFVPNRLSVAKEIAIDFIQTLPGSSSVGIISFAGNTYIQQKLTENKQLLKSSINQIKLDSYGGTDVYEAISISANLLENEENKAIILLSDGQVNIGDITLVIDLLNKEEIVLHSVAIGTPEGGKVSYGISKLDSDILQSLAYSSNGEFFEVQDKQELKNSFNEIMHLINKLGKINLSPYLLILAILLFLLNQFLRNVNKIY